MVVKKRESLPPCALMALPAIVCAAQFQTGSIILSFSFRWCNPSAMQPSPATHCPLKVAHNRLLTCYSVCSRVAQYPSLCCAGKGRAARSTSGGGGVRENNRGSPQYLYFSPRSPLENACRRGTGNGKIFQVIMAIISLDSSFLPLLGCLCLFVTLRSLCNQGAHIALQRRSVAFQILIPRFSFSLSPS